MLRPKFNMGAIHKKLEEANARVRKGIILNLQRLGEMCVNEARQGGSYQDHTGNLRSSTGYIIVENGRIIKRGGFTDIPMTGGGKVGNARNNGSDAKGSSVGAAVAEAIAERDFSDFFAPVLIVVAGMNYAFYVETRGYNVLSTAEHLAKARLPEMMKQLKSQINT